LGVEVPAAAEFGSAGSGEHSDAPQGLDIETFDAVSMIVRHDESSGEPVEGFNAPVCANRAAVCVNGIVTLPHAAWTHSEELMLHD
jgi:hypothetical protein